MKLQKQGIRFVKTSQSDSSERPSSDTLEAWEVEFEHPPPFSQEELAGWRSFRLRRQRDLASLVPHDWQGRSFSIRHCSPKSLDFLTTRPDIRFLDFWYSEVRDLEFIRSLPKLKMVDLRGCLIQDATPLLELDTLYTLGIGGNPLGEHSYREVLPELRRRGVAMEGDAGPYPEAEWRLMRWLREANLDVVALNIHGQTRCLVPGLILDPNPGSVSISPRQVREVFDSGEGWDTASFFAALHTKAKAEGYQE